MRAANRPFLILIAAAALVAAPTSAGRAAAPAAPAATDGVSASAAPPSAERAIVRPASLKRVSRGYYFGTWGQDNRTTVTLVEGRLRFRDPRAVRWEDLARICDNRPVRRGVAAVCPVPDGVSAANPLTIILEMRLGDDTVDTSTLPAQFNAEVLADAGFDEIRTGDGDDFVNGAFQRDLIVSGAGNDWVRSGEANDRVFGGDGRDRLVGGRAGDLLHGQGGIDLVEGGPGADRVYGDLGADRLKCGDGNDAAERDPADTQRIRCERTTG